MRSCEGHWGGCEGANDGMAAGRGGYQRPPGVPKNLGTLTELQKVRVFWKHSALATITLTSASVSVALCSLSGLHLLVVMSGPMDIFKVTSRSVAPTCASRAPTELWMGQPPAQWMLCLAARRAFQAWQRLSTPLGFPQTLVPQPSGGASPPTSLRKWHHWPTSCSSPDRGVPLDPRAPLSCAPATWGLCLQGTRASSWPVSAVLGRSVLKSLIRAWHSPVASCWI